MLKDFKSLSIKTIKVCSSFSSFNVLRTPKNKMDITNDHIQERYDDIIISQMDKRNYRGLLLKNRLKVLLISDPVTQKAAASMSLNIGFMSDPKEIPGLAHFCEHMLFLGTEKYPEESEYEKYLNDHGGACNASTSMEFTAYYFDVAAEHLRGALDRFSQFFIAPLFTESATDRELKAVHSEYEKNVLADAWRMIQLERSTARPDHPFNTFGTGNLETLETNPKKLGLNVRQALLDFHTKYYSANLLSLAVIGKETLDELENMVVPMFCSIKNKGIEVPVWDEQPYGDEHLKVRLNVVSVKDLRRFHIVFPIPDYQPHYKTNPGHYYGNLIGHEGPGSLLSLLKFDKGWVNSLAGGVKEQVNGFGLFIIDFDMTEEGMNHIDEIIGFAFQYIEMLRREGPKQWVFDELKILKKIHFDYRDKEKPFLYSGTLSTSLHLYPFSEVVCGNYFLHDYDEPLLKSVLDYLVPDNMRVLILSKSNEGKTDLIEPWYGTHYTIEKLDDAFIKSLKNVEPNPALKLPAPNEFMPENLKLLTLEKKIKHPILLRSDEMFEVWYKQDDEFLLPKAILLMHIESPISNASPHNANLTFLFLNLVKDAFNEYIYAATLAGLKCNMTFRSHGLTVMIHGFSDKQDVLLKVILNKMTKLDLSEKRFEIIKEAYKRPLKNFKMDQPLIHASHNLDVLLSSRTWTNDNLLNCLDESSPEKLREHIPKLFSQLFIKCFLYGNLQESVVNHIIDTIKTIMLGPMETKPLFPCQLNRDRELRLVEGSHQVLQIENPIHQTSAVLVYLQCFEESTHNNALIELFVQMLSQPCFNVLRTTEQLGYIVSSSTRGELGVRGVKIFIQSSHRPRFVDSRIEAFLESMEEKLNTMSEDEFQRHISSLASRRLEIPKNFTEYFFKIYQELLCQQYNFERDQIEVEVLKKLTLEDIKQFYRDYIHRDGPKRRKLAIHVAPDFVNEEDQKVDLLPGIKMEVIREEEIWDFRNRHGFHAPSVPYVDKNQFKLN